jgi:rubredoxin
MQPTPPPLPHRVLPYATGIRCPRCSHGESKPVSFTWWGGLIGPKLFNHVKCTGCGYAYNGKTGRPNTTAIVLYTVVVGVIAAIGGFVLVFSRV